MFADDNSNGDGAAAPSFPLDRPVVEALPNMAKREWFENVRVNSLRKLHWLWCHEVKKEPCLIVGSGPSLADDLEEIRERKRNGAVIVALNGAVGYLADRGLEVDWQFMLDGRASNVKFVKPLRAKYILLGSHCDPSLFDAVPAERIVLFHTMMPDLEKYLPPKTRYTHFVGGLSSGLAVLPVVVSGMGYRELHLYGYDSSDRDDKARPFDQHENDAEQLRVDVVCARKTFRCSYTMYNQAERFSDYAFLIEREGATVMVHGDGLLPTLIREKGSPPETDAAIYDLNSAPASWDFLPWLANATMAAKERGVERLRVSFMTGPNLGFRSDTLPGDFEARTAFLDGVMRPALDLFGAVEDPTVQVGHGHDYMLAPVCGGAKRGIVVPTISAPQWALDEVDAELNGKEPVVVTLREASHWQNRNSNLDAWLDFADTLIDDDGEEVVIVRDTERALELIRGYRTFPRASLDLKVRAALYERAKANLFVANGPMAIAYFGTRPFLIFKPLVDGYGPATAQWWSDKIGVPVGEQYPWCRPDQRIVWDDDSFENITRAWAGLLPLLARRSRAAA